MIGVDVWWVYLPSQNIASVTELTLPNKVIHCLQNTMITDTNNTAVHTLNFIFGDVAPLKYWNSISASLASSILGTCQNVTTSECNGDAGFLNGGGFLPAFFKNTHQQWALQAKVFKFIAFCVGHILVVGKKQDPRFSWHVKNQIYKQDFNDSNYIVWPPTPISSQVKYNCKSEIYIVIICTVLSNSKWSSLFYKVTVLTYPMPALFNLKEFGSLQSKVQQPYQVTQASVWNKQHNMASRETVHC